MKKLYSAFRLIILVLFVFLITMSAHPKIVMRSKGVGLESGTILSRYIEIVFGVLFVLCLNIKSFLKSSFIRRSLLLLFIILFAYLCTFVFFNSRVMMGDFRAIGICIVAIMIGWQISLNRKSFVFVVLLFSALTVYVGFMQIRTFIGGFNIEDQYLTAHKNALGAMLATSLVLFMLVFCNTDRKRWWRRIYVCMMIFTFVVMLTIRVRAAMLASIIVLLMVYYLNNKKGGKSFVITVLAMCVLIGLIIVVLPSSAKEFIYNSFTQNQGDDITSGRMWRNIAAIEFIMEHPFFGNLNQGIHIAQIHNYPLITLYKYGLLFALPILILYLMIIVHAIKRSFRYKEINMFSIGYIAMFIPYIISMAEPTMPFGPGTAMTFNFFLFGVSLRNTYEISDASTTSLD